MTGGTGDARETWEYDPSTDSWEQRADCDGACKDVWRYDPAANSWTSIATFPGTARWDALGLSLGDAGLVAGEGRIPGI